MSHPAKRTTPFVLLAALVLIVGAALFYFLGPEPEVEGAITMQEIAEMPALRSVPMAEPTTLAERTVVDPQLAGNAEDPAPSPDTLAKSGSLLGILIDLQNLPLAEEPIVVSKPDEIFANREKPIRTNDQGEFRIADLEPGVWSVFHRQGGPHASEPTLFLLGDVQIVEGETTTQLFYLEPGVSLIGVATVQDGQKGNEGRIMWLEVRNASDPSRLVARQIVTSWANPPWGNDPGEIDELLRLQLGDYEDAPPPVNGAFRFDGLRPDRYQFWIVLSPTSGYGFPFDVDLTQGDVVMEPIHLDLE